MKAEKGYQKGKEKGEKGKGKTGKAGKAGKSSGKAGKAQGSPADAKAKVREKARAAPSRNAEMPATPTANSSDVTLSWCNRECEGEPLLRRCG